MKKLLDIIKFKFLSSFFLEKGKSIIILKLQITEQGGVVSDVEKYNKTLKLFSEVEKIEQMEQWGYTYYVIKGVLK